MMLLGERGRAALAAIVGAPEAWSRWEDVERDHGGELLDALVMAELVVAWIRPDYVALTLTPLGAYRLGVEIEEEWRDAVEDREEWDESRPALAPAVSRERTKIETPTWTEEKVMDSRKPIKLPRHARIGSTLVAPERVMARAPEEDEPDYLLDADGEPVKVLGLPVRIDRRMGRRPGR